ncbi:MAG TPA: YbhB/YbcL family Raf kinase inhibitor-like protein, partial [Planctomycetota bacterium]|nr:YbhB/YbcL family Raf kinase inhibitor-like protein [Planctomycetota bacterium]
EGDDVSPPLRWEDLPEGTQEIAILCEDPDAPRTKPWVHWIAWGISPRTDRLMEGATDGGSEGRNDFGNIGYGGPMPPKGHGTHHYHFKVYALDAPLPLDMGATKDELVRTMSGHVLEEAVLVGTYERR